MFKQYKPLPQAICVSPAKPSTLKYNMKLTQKNNDIYWMHNIDDGSRKSFINDDFYEEQF